MSQEKIYRTELKNKTAVFLTQQDIQYFPLQICLQLLSVRQSTEEGRVQLRCKKNQLDAAYLFLYSALSKIKLYSHYKKLI